MKPMLSLAFLVCALGASTGCAHAQEAPSAAETAEPDSLLIRMTLVPSDMDRSAAFYRDVLGYEITFDGNITKPMNRLLLNTGEGETARFIVLKGANAIDGQPLDSAGIGLLEIVGRKDLPSLAQPAGNSLASGQAMMAIVTNDIDAVIERAEAFGAPILVGPLEAETPRGREREIVILDPDNTRIHVVQLLPSEEADGDG